MCPRRRRRVSSMARMRVVTIKINEETLEILDMIARSKKISRSELIRSAIRLALSRWIEGERRE